MSWVCGIDILKGDATKKEIELKLLNEAENNRSGRYQPQIGHIKYTGKVFETYEQAVNYVKSFDKHDGNIVAQFKALSDKGEKLLREKLKPTDDKIKIAYQAFLNEKNKLEKEFRTMVQSKTKPFITCPKCKSKLNVEVINPHNNCCPLSRCNSILVESKELQKLLKTYESIKAKREELKQKEHNKLMTKNQELKTIVMGNIYIG